jgi:WXXGXW repeat (2 copies)
MKVFRSARWLVLAFLISLIPATSHAGVFISVGFAPPALVAYDQPPCPEPGWMWQPGYWAYGDQGYYWIPGTWVPAPYAGALWTPGYWGFSTGVYVWHPGYWGPHVGYYGGVNYGFGYMGIGFVGGAWHGGVFSYNTAVVHVNTMVVRNVYVDRTIVERNTIVNDRHVAYSGGPGGIRHDPAPQERIAERDQHMAPTAFQQQHAQAAMHDGNAYFNSNHGRPANVAGARPMTFNGGEARGNWNAQPGGRPNQPEVRTMPAQQRPQPQMQMQQQRQQQQWQQQRPQQQQQQQVQQRQMQQQRQQPETQQRQQSQTRPESHPQQERPQQEQQRGGGGNGHEHMR